MINLRGYSCFQTVLLSWQFFSFSLFHNSTWQFLLFHRKSESLIASVSVLCVDLFLPSLALSFLFVHACMMALTFSVKQLFNPYVVSLHGDYRERLPASL